VICRCTLSIRIHRPPANIQSAPWPFYGDQDRCFGLSPIRKRWTWCDQTMKRSNFSCEVSVWFPLISCDGCCERKRRGLLTLLMPAFHKQEKVDWLSSEPAVDGFV
jgi:hypothetical protein